jgi:hypothetical protein
MATASQAISSVHSAFAFHEADLHAGDAICRL